MVRQWQEFFYESNYQSTPLISPDFVKLADAHGIAGRAVRTRAEVASAVEAARTAKGAYLLNFMVEKEDSVYPMIPGRQRTARDDPPSREGPAARVAEEL